MSDDDARYKRTVACKHCGKPIVIRSVTGQLTEFSVKCDHCGKRSFYDATEIEVEGRR